MEKESFINKNNKVILWIFIAITIVHVLYAAFSVRVAYMDGTPQLLHILNNIANGTTKLYIDPGHPRFFVSALMQLPSFLVAKMLILSSKFSISVFYSFCWFAISPLLVYFNYKLSNRTKNYDTFIASLFFYSMVILLYQIFVVVESSVAILTILLLYNYIRSKIDYTTKDLVIIALLTIMLFASHELVLFCVPILLVSSLLFAKDEENTKNKITKISVGIASLFAFFYIYFFMFKIKGNGGEISRFLNEFFGSLGTSFDTSFSITIVGLILIGLVIAIFKSKKELTIKHISIATVIIFYNLYIMFRQLDLYVNPIIEGHYRVIDIFLFPIILFFIAVKDIAKKEISPVILNNTITIIAIVGIAQTIWQIDNTYWWNKNIEYMQDKLQKCETSLYIPDPKEPPISKFFENDKRNYIWHADYTAISILFAKDYEVKTILGIYDKLYEENNATERQLLFSNDNNLFMPYITVDIKNKFWDLTEPAKALDLYNTTHNIKTNKQN